MTIKEQQLVQPQANFGTPKVKMILDNMEQKV